MNDPKVNTKFAAFFAEKANAQQTNKALLQKFDTSGMVLIGVLDNVRRVPAKRSPGSICVTMITNRCKIFDNEMFEKTDDNSIILKKDLNNPENRILKNYETILLGSFTISDDIEDSVGCLVKCHGFSRNASGYLVAKSIQVIQKEKIETVMGLSANIPKIVFESSEEKYKTILLQFRSGDQNHNDWTNTKGNASSVNINEDCVFLTEENELVFKGNCDVMSFDDQTNLYLVQLYWNAGICRQFGVTNKDNWPKLAPVLLPHFRGFIQANIDVIASSGLAMNDADNSSETYTKGYKIYSNNLCVDMRTTIEQSGEEINQEQLLEHFDEEYFLESDYSTDNPLNDKNSLVRNLDEYSGSLKKIIGEEGVKFFKISGNDATNVFAILTKPLTRKRTK